MPFRRRHLEPCKIGLRTETRRRCSSPPRAPTWPPRRHRADGTRHPRGRCARSHTARRARATSRRPFAAQRALRAAVRPRGAPRLAHAPPSLPASRLEPGRDLLQLDARATGRVRSSPPCMISTKAGRARARSSGAVAADSARRIAATAASARPCARRNCASPGCGSHRTRSPCGTPPRRHEGRPAGEGARPAGQQASPAARFPVSTKRSPARRASSSAAGHAPSSWWISARCTRQRPVNATISGWSAHQS